MQANNIDSDIHSTCSWKRGFTFGAQGLKVKGGMGGDKDNQQGSEEGEIESVCFSLKERQRGCLPFWEMNSVFF